MVSVKKVLYHTLSIYTHIPLFFSIYLLPVTRENRLNAYPITFFFLYRNGQRQTRVKTNRNSKRKHRRKRHTKTHNQPTSLTPQTPKTTSPKQLPLSKHSLTRPHKQESQKHESTHNKYICSFSFKSIFPRDVKKTFGTLFLVSVKKTLTRCLCPSPQSRTKGVFRYKLVIIAE